MKVVVFGASGVIGRALVPALVERHEVVAVSRTPRPESGRARWVTADATREETLDAALAGADAVVYLVHSLGSPEFAEVDRLAATNVASAAERNRVRQIVEMGATTVCATPTYALRMAEVARERRFDLPIFFHLCDQSLNSV